MRNRWTRRGIAWALAAAAFAALVTGPAGAATSVPAPSSTEACAHAHALYQAGYYADAEAAYKKLLGVDSCASVADIRSVQQQLRKQAKTAATLIAEAKYARDAGFEAKSRAIVQQLVQQYPSTPIPSGLRDPNQRIGWEQGVLGTIGPVLRLVAEALIALLAGAAIVLLLRAAWRALGKRKPPSLLVVPFVGAHYDGAGEATMSALREHLTHLGESTSGRSPYFADSAEHDFDLPAAIGTSFPEASLIAGLLTLLSRLSPNRPWRVTGTLRPADPERGAGLTLVLARRRNDAIPPLTVWERDFFLVPSDAAAKAAGDGDALLARYQRLALPAAVWLAFSPALGHNPDEPALGTKRWRSYASFAVGEDAQELGEDACARRLYDDALVRDPGNLGARTNLAAILLSPDPGESKEAKSERLRLLRDQICFVLRKLGHAPTNPLWYRIRYVKTIGLLYNEDFEPARASADELLRDIEGELAKRDPDSPSALDSLLLHMRFPVEILRANAALEICAKTRGRLSCPDVKEPQSPGDEWVSANGHYNLACHYARRLKLMLRLKLGPPSEITRVQNLAFMHLRQALSFGDDSLRAGVRTDPALEILAQQDRIAFDQLVPDPASAPKPSGDGTMHATIAHGTVIAVETGDGPDGDG